MKEQNNINTKYVLFLVDKWGRKALMLTGAGGLAVIYIVMATGYYLQVKGFYMLLWVVIAISIYYL